MRRGKKNSRSYKQYQKEGGKKKRKNKKVSQMSKGEAFSEMTALEPGQINSKRWEQLCSHAGYDPKQRRKELADQNRVPYDPISSSSHSSYGSFGRRRNSYW